MSSHAWYLLACSKDRCNERFCPCEDFEFLDSWELQRTFLLAKNKFIFCQAANARERGRMNRMSKAYTRYDLFFWMSSGCLSYDILSSVKFPFCKKHRKFCIYHLAFLVDSDCGPGCRTHTIFSPRNKRFSRWHIFRYFKFFGQKVIPTKLPTYLTTYLPT